MFFKSRREQAMKVAELQNQIIDLTTINVQLLDDKVRLGDQLQSTEESLMRCKKEGICHREEVAEMLAETDKLRDLVRDQTSADLLYNALHAVGIIQKKVNRPRAFDEQERLINLRGQAGLSSLVDGHGVFGRAAAAQGQDGSSLCGKI